MRSDRKKSLLRSALLGGGICVTLIGIMHIFMPAMGYENTIPLSMPGEVSNHFYYLGTYAICTFLLTLGFLSIYASRIHHPDVSFVICSAFSLLWISRTVLEIIYPVRLKLFFLSVPTVVLLPLIILIATVYTGGSVSYILSRNK